MDFKKMKEWYSFDVPSNQKKNFETGVSINNLIKSIVTAIFFLGMQIIVIPIFIIMKRSVFLDYPNYLYLCMYLIMAVTMSILIMVFTKMNKKDAKNYVENNRVIIIFTIFLQAWCATISLLDQLSSGQIIVYIISTICIAILPVFRTRTLLPIFASIHILFLILLPVFQKSPDKIFENSINTTSNIVIALIISRFLFKSKLDDFMNKVIIEEKTMYLTV